MARLLTNGELRRQAGRKFQDGKPVQWIHAPQLTAIGGEFAPEAKILVRSSGTKKPKRRRTRR